MRLKRCSSRTWPRSSMDRASAFEAEGGRFEPCGYTVRGRAVTTTNATHTSDMNPKPTTSNMSMVLPEERASPLKGWGRRGRLYRFDRLRGVGAGPPARHAPTGASLPQRAARVCRSEDRGYLNSALAVGRVADLDRASAFEAEGCRFEPSRSAGCCRSPRRRITPMPPGGLIRRGCPREPGGMQR